jgi:predicted nicotinamide N-methyase
MRDARRDHVTVPDARTVSRVLAEYHTRTTPIELTPELTLAMTEAHHTPRHSHWSRLWPSSIGLARWLLAEDTLPTHSTELGCGLGLVSLALAHRGVLAEGTDRVAHALAFAAHNAAQNELTGFSTRLLDWSEPSGTPRTLIVGADLVYEPESPARLFDVVETSGLLVPGGRLVLSGPHRRRDLAGDLIRRLVVEGYRHTESDAVVNWEGGVERIDVHVLWRP